MSLSEQARERLADVRELEPASNGELQERWGMDSGKDVAAYLRNELGEHTYRDDDSRIRAVARDDDPTEDTETPESPDEPGGEAAAGADRVDAPDVDPVGDAAGPTQAGRGGVDAALEPSAGAVTVTPGEFENAVETAYEAGRQESEPEPVEVESTTADDAGESGSGVTGGCPECGDSFTIAGSGFTYETTTGDRVTTEAGDLFCADCDILVGPDGDEYQLVELVGEPSSGGGAVRSAVRWVGYGCVAVAAVVGAAVAGGDDDRDSGPGFRGEL